MRDASDVRVCTIADDPAPELVWGHHAGMTWDGHVRGMAPYRPARPYGPLTLTQVAVLDGTLRPGTWDHADAIMRRGMDEGR